MLFPAGQKVDACDGRSFKNRNPAAVVAAFKSYGKHLPFDVNHSTHLKAPKGEDSPAAGWITDLDVREGAIWGSVEWTRLGREALADKTYKYVSPGFLPTAEGDVSSLLSAGLVNRPAFTQLPALAAQLNSDTEAASQPIEDPMDKALLKLLGLAETASAAEASAVVTALLKQVDEAHAELASFRASAAVELAAARDPAVMVPRAELTVVLARAETAEAQLKVEQDAKRQELVDGLIAAGMRDGKITPATKGYYVQLCAQDPEAFKAFIEVAPVVVTAGATAVQASPVVTGAAISSLELEVAAHCGLTPDQFKAGK
jgi:phage I-like protein